MDEHAVALSRAERQRLRDIEGGLVRDDPDLAAAFADIESSTVPPSRSRARWVIGLGVGGVAVLGAGLISGLPVLGVFGFAVVVAALSQLVQDDRLVSAVRSRVRPIVEHPDRLHEP